MSVAQQAMAVAKTAAAKAGVAKNAAMAAGHNTVSGAKSMVGEGWGYLRETVPGMKFLDDHVYMKGGLALTAAGLLATPAINQYMNGQPEDMGNGRVHKNSPIEMLYGGAQIAGGIALGFTKLGAGVVGGAIGVAQVAKPFADMYRMSMTDRRMAKRSFHRPDLSPLFSQRTFSSQQHGISRIMDSMSFIGNEARHMAARGM